MLQILWEVTAGTIGKAPAVATDALPTAEGASALPVSPEADEESEEDMEEMRSRLQALKS